MRVVAIVVAAGSGSRMQTKIKKPYLEIAGVPLLVRTLRALERSALIREIVLVVREEELAEAKRLIDQYGIRKVIRYAAGGAERQDSVRNGLRMVDDAADLIVVHDGARPFVTADEIDRVIAAAAECGAATIGTPVKDTIKKVADGTVEETLPRETLFAVQTPQAFRAQLLRKAHAMAVAAGCRSTDDASLVEWTGHPVRVVEGSYRNIKITTPEDLLIAEAFVEREL
ncbi:2-C-methyl-D-erythritol 4-phosphate cytidylyltransferase [Effusibacillus pohliae]|uniref:2-C-methyl-D-erythritol 4-phosphate cytidylyltransferase n=1 Tax=Effusibacillus pohliae TaxID=232270 RepID=UPI00035C5F8A|nr:2-C-methyl-D-erythritol 4-phosphate cytidylyltransferase [Effusibacillus pohliae]